MVRGERAGHHACASCKYSRKKCKPDCFLAPYFPAATHSQDFLLVHKLFTASSLIKMLKAVEPEQRALTAKTLVLEAKAWQENPSIGCLGLTRKLHYHLERLKKELAAVREQIARERSKAQLLSLGPLPVSPLMQHLGISFNNPQPPTLLDYPNEGSNYVREAMSLGSSSAQPMRPAAPPRPVQDEEFEDVKPIIIKPIEEEVIEDVKPIFKPIPASMLAKVEQKHKAIAESKDSKKPCVKSSLDGKGKGKAKVSSFA